MAANGSKGSGKLRPNAKKAKTAIDYFEICGMIILHSYAPMAARKMNLVVLKKEST